MAIAISSSKVWFTNSIAYDFRAFDIARLENGRILVAFGGAEGSSPVLRTALLDTSNAKLGAIDTTTWTATSFSGAVRKLEISAGDGANAMIALHSTFSSAGGNDSNFSLVTQRVKGGTQLNVDPLPVNPAAPDENTHDDFSTVHLKNGGYAVFFSEPGTGFTDLSNGIRMTRFDEKGARLGGPKTVIGEKIVNAQLNLQNNPEQPAAIQMRNGNIGLLYKENTELGNTRFLFQELTIAGKKVGSATNIIEGSVNPGIEVLQNGQIVVSWFDVAAGTHRARVLDAEGDPAGAAFSVSGSGLAAYSAGAVSALAKGFASSWFDTANGLWMGQLFTNAGAAKSNPFLLTDSAGEFGNGTIGGITRTDTGFVGFVNGPRLGEFFTTLEGQSFSSVDSLGANRKGTGADQTLDGTAKDDVITLAGGNDKSKAGAGNDIVDGGSGKDLVEGGAGFDRVQGADGNDTLLGGAGTDILLGGLGNDRLNGDSGSDRLTGDFGRDTLTGGDGADVFIFSGRTDAMTTVTDFNAAEGDKLKILASVYGFLGIFTPVVGTEANPDVRGLYFNSRTHILSHDTDGAGTFYQRVNVAYLPDVDTLAITDLLTF